MSYSCYKLTDTAKQRLLTIIKPRFKNIKADHITYEFPSNELPPIVNECFIYAECHDNNIQAVLVNINGKTERPDGKKYHITISHNDNVKPVQSNTMIPNTPFKSDTYKLKLNVIPTIQ